MTSIGQEPGIRTVSTTYTVALAVGMLPHSTFAGPPVVPTVNASPEPSTLMVSPASVLWVPASWSGESFPPTTWWLRILVSVALSASTPSRVFLSILANASSVGANTVIASAEFRVSPRPATPTAETRVFSSGLLLAAVATGSVAMPLNEPLPSDGISLQPGPKVSAAALMVSDVVGLEDAVLFDPVEPESSLLPQAARVNVSAREVAAIAPVLRR